MSIDERHAAHDQDPSDMPTMTLAEKAPTRNPQEARTDVAMKPDAASSTQREPAITGAPVEESPAGAHPSTTPSDESAITGADSPAHRVDAARSETQRSSDTSLFADDELAGLRARWDSVQAGFVDDPRDCVHKADGLVSDVVGQLTTGFTEARSRLEHQWSRGEEASTEDLRVALTRYRDFFQRLLAV